MAHQHLWVDPFSGLSGDIWIGGWVLGMIQEPSGLEPFTQIISTGLPTLDLRDWPVQGLEADRCFSYADADGESGSAKEGR